MPRVISIVSFENRLDDLFNKIHILPDDIEIRSHWARYLCILSYGYIETSVRNIFLDYAKNKAHPYLVNFIEKRLDRFRNATMNNVKELAQMFSQEWVEAIDNNIDQEVIDAVNSLANNRHQISHGKNTGISLAYVKNWHAKSRELINYLEMLTAK